MQQARSSISASAYACLALLCLAALWSPTSVLGAGRVIGAASSMTTIFPEAPPAVGDLASGITLYAARGESESAQIVIVAGDSALDIQSVQVSDLRRVAARIAKGNIEVRLVGYANLTQSSGRGTHRLGRTPDPLLEFRPFTCPAGEDRLLWVTVKVPASTPPGVYTGKIKVYSPTSLVASLPISVTVWHFTLPEMPYYATNYWTATDKAYDYSVDPQAFMQTIKLLADYRVSTNLWPGGDLAANYMRDYSLLFYLEPDGSITADISGLQRTINEARQNGGIGTFEIGNGCWWGSQINGAGLINRQTGQYVDAATRQAALDNIAASLPPEQLVGFPGSYFERLYLPPMCDWLQSQGLLNRSFIQLYDEATDQITAFPSIASLYQQWRSVEPRMKLLGLTGLYPSMSGVYDIWSPYLFLYDRPTYDLVWTGQSLYGPKNFAATVSATSYVTSGSYEVKYYLPADAYDGCDYTKWAPAAWATASTPQRIRFDFPPNAGNIDGFRVVAFPFLPWEFGAPTTEKWVVEVSLDGTNFSAPVVTQRAGVTNGYSFSVQAYKAIRLSRVIIGSAYDPGVSQDIPALNQASPIMYPGQPVWYSVADGLREMEFLRQGLPLESTLSRQAVRPSEMWEYQIGYYYPSVNIDADPVEMRAHGWLAWSRGVVGYLNYGGAQCDASFRPTSSPDPLVWTVGGDPGQSFVIYPGADQPLPSIRLARFRDSVDDYDYLCMLNAKQSDHPVLEQLRYYGQLPFAWTMEWMNTGSGHPPYDTVDNMLAARQTVGEALDQFYTTPGGRWILGGGGPRKLH